MNFGKLCLFGLLTVITACSAPAEIPEPSPGTNVVAVIGAVHGQHRRSESYSLTVLRAAITKFDPEIIMVELPTERFSKASANYQQFGEVRESRADDFPELIDVVFPLREALDFEMVPVAAWTQNIADDRRATLARVKQDPSRAKDWAAHQAAITTYNQAVRGRSDDPLFIHSQAYDNAVKARQESYEKLFGDDLGAGGWQTINAAHFQKVAAALDDVKGQEKRILILYGAWHKYWFLEQLETRDDIQLINAAELFSG
ncbi:hypothetical protein [Parasphingorhabdus cellanae]|uniref:Haem-binding uptake Tiki superfamily ChaN domain-containing protein n=1 Tax=Parasphingorhabdus cellanae TaxID=2806553 RepID=A0ABX7T1R0_9SPHN|nr:hypothetical protein [Parasphingorhabdus cellanae]QTD55091.1 hypothetical protein J4G78_12765 [Parasphingorhabdus cellanae]